MKNTNEIMNLKAANKKLLEQINLQEEIINSTEAIIVVINTDFTVSLLSKGAEKILGHSSKSLINKNWFNVVAPPNKFPEIIESYKSFLKSTKKSRTIVEPAICKDKSLKKISWKTHKIYNNKKLVGSVSIGKDVTEIEKEINSLKESESKFKALAELLPTPISCKNLDNKTIFLNKAYISNFGYTLKDIPDFNAWLKVAYKNNADRKEALKHWNESVSLLKSGKKVKTKIIRVYTKSNELRILKHDITISGNNIYCSYYDITNDVNKEAILEENKNRFKKLAELAPTPISFITTDGKILFFNKAYTEIFGYTINEVPTVEKLLEKIYTSKSERESALRLWKKDVRYLKNNPKATKKGNAVVSYTASGEKKLIEYSATLHDNFIYYAYLDVTIQQEKERILLKSKETFERIAENTPIPVGACNIDTFDLSFSNKKFEETFGYKYTDNVSFHTWSNLLVYTNLKEKEIKEAEFNNYVVELMQHKNKKNKILERRIKCKDKDIRTFEIGFTYDSNLLYAFFYDVTSRKESELNLKESELRFRSLAEQMTIGIAFITREGKFHFLNKAFTTNFGYSIKKFPDIHSIVNHTHFDPKIRQAELEYWKNEIETIFTTGKKVKRRIDIETASGEKRIVEYTALLSGNFVYYVYTDITDQKKKEDDLRKSVDTFKSIAENTPIAIAGCNVNNNFEMTFINNKFINDIGYSIKDLKKFDNWIQMVQYDSEDEKINAINRWKGIINVFQNNSNAKVDPYERKIKRKNGSIGTYEIGLAFDNGTLYAFFYDVTNRKIAEEKLLASENRFRNIVENLPLPLVSINSETNTIFANKKHADLVGYNNTKRANKSGDLNTFSIDDLTNEDDKNRFQQTINLLKTNTDNHHIVIPPYVTKILCRDKVVRTFEISENIFGNTLYTLFNDITEQNLAREILIESEQKFRALAENMPVAIGSYDENGKSTFVNKTFTKITGYELQDVPTVIDWYKQTQPNVTRRLEFYNFWENAVNNFKTGKVSEPISVSATSKCKDGHFRHFMFSFSIYNNITYLMLIDITEQEKAKKQLELSHNELRTLTKHLQHVREEERKSISREIHDELGQQVTGIKMVVSSIFKKLPIQNNDDDKSRKEVIEMLNNTVKTVRHISSQLRPSALDDLGIVAAFEWFIKDFEKRTNINCILYSNVDESEINKNLQENLFRLLQESLTNISRHANATQVNVDFFIFEKQLRLIIADNGKGFNLNVPRKTLGLVGMRERVSLFNGTFDVVSEKNKGTRIIISIPINK